MRRDRRYKKRYKVSNQTVAFAAILLLGILGYTTLGPLFQSLRPIDFSTVVGVIFGLFIFLLIFGYLYFKYLKVDRVTNFTLNSTDSMSGFEFENFVAALYEKQGYRVEKTPVTGDFGVDLIATRGDKKIAIQVKRYKATVGRSAISDAVAGMIHYKCGSCAVVTNSFFTPLARKLATSNRCQLIDRASLEKMIGKVTHS